MSVSNPKVLEDTLQMASCGIQQKTLDDSSFSINGAVVTSASYICHNTTPNSTICKDMYISSANDDTLKQLSPPPVQTTVSVVSCVVSALSVLTPHKTVCNSTPVKAVTQNEPRTYIKPGLFPTDDKETLKELLCDLPPPCFKYNDRWDTVVKRADTCTTTTSTSKWTKPQPAIVGPYTPNYVTG